jgi:hypothetical protein
MSWCRYSSRYFHRFQTLLIVVLIVPTLLFAVAIKAARASIYQLQPILCDSSDDQTSAPFLCALPKETPQESSSTKPRLNFPGKPFAPLISRCRLAALGTARTTPYVGPTLQLKRLLAQRAGSADDPDSH